MIYKICSKCKIEKTLDSFYKLKRSKDGFQYSCKACSRAYDKANAERISRQHKEKYYENHEQRLIQRKEYVNKPHNKERKKITVKQWRKKNKVQISETNKAYDKRHKAEKTARTAKRRSARLSATPAWANKQKIKEIYNLSSFLSMATFGEGYHVDHIVPLQGKNVCGLHVENNLQVMRAGDNLRKGNNHACR